MQTALDTSSKPSAFEARVLAHIAAALDDAERFGLDVNGAGLALVRRRDAKALRALLSTNKDF